jgi:nicotinamidase-related amidase
MTALDKVAVVLVDVINAMDFEGHEALVAAATEAAGPIEELCRRARAQGVPVIYANDNFGLWRSDFKATVDACAAPDKPGAEISSRLRPLEGDYFVLKPRHSAFYQTPLSLVLEHLAVDTLVLAGFATDLCILFTAHDAHMRGYNLIVPEDCTASNSLEATQRTLEHLRRALKCATGSSVTLDFAASSE